MLTVHQTYDKQLVTSIMCDPQLFLMAMTDEELALYDEGEWEPNMDGWTFLAFKQDDVPVGILRFREISTITVEAHPHILPKYHGTGIFNEINELFDEWLDKNTYYHKIMTQVPKPCVHSLKAAAKNGFEIEGVLTGGIFWRGNVEDLIIMCRFIRRD